MRRWPLAGLLVALLVLLPAVASADGLRLAVAEFDNAADTDTYDALGKGLQAMVTTDLAQVEGLTLVERERLAELVSELELAGSGMVDPATAAKVGKLLGATHMVAGTFTVVGEAMRLDARLVAVDSGEVVVAADADGEREAFFELEKELVKALLAALDAELSPKERAAIARIHTADFESFVKFSQGVALYDAERYEEAVATLERVLAADEDFKLARRTLESYEQLLEEIRAKTRALEITEAESRFVARQQEAAADAATVAWLYQRTDDPAASFETRMSALYLLTVGLAPRGFTSGGFRELKRNEDEFALARASEVAYARFYAEMRPRWPELSPFVFVSLGSWFSGNTDEMEDKFAYMRRSLFEKRQLRDLNTCRGQDHFVEREADLLHLDWRERTLELDRLSEHGRACIGEDDYADARIEVATMYGQLMDLDRSTAVLEALAASTEDTRLLQKIEHRVDQNRELATVLEEVEAAPTFREQVLLKQKGKSFIGSFSKHWLRDARAGEARGLWELARARKLGDWVFARYLWVDDELAWVLPSRQPELVSGPRTDPLRTSSLRYYGNGVPKVEFERLREPPPPEAAWVLLGAGPRTDFSLSVRVDHTPADDWWPVQLPPPREGEAVRQVSEGRPLVGVVFGVNDVNVDAVCDPAGVGMTSVPMQGWGVLLEEEAVVLARVHEVDPDWSEKRCSLFTDFVDDWAAEEVARATVPAGRDRRKLEVAVSGNRVTVKVGGTTRRFTLAEPAEGFVGLVMDGVGYAELSELDME
jgi:TolB-like protein